jgi:hypothetical protein
MMLYLANCTKQNRIFAFRVPGISQLFDVEIPAGTQRQVWKDEEKEIVDALVQQMVPYGFCDVSTASRERHFVGVCFSRDKPVPAELMDYTIDRNDGVLDEVAAVERKRTIAALATNREAIQGGMRPNTVEMTIEETPDRSNPDRLLKSETVAIGERRAARGR